MEKTNLQMEYERFEKTSTVILYAVLGLAMILSALFLLGGEELKLVSGLLMVIDTFAVIFISANTVKKRKRYRALIREEKRNSAQP